MKKRGKVKWGGGSLTVEASLLLPFLWFIIFMLVCLGLYLHDRCVLSASAAELAGKGAALKYQSKEEKEHWLVNQGSANVENRLLSLKRVEITVQAEKERVTVRYTGRTDFLRGVEICEEETAKCLNPVSDIRKGRLLGKVWKQIGEE